MVLIMLVGWYRWALAPISGDALESKIFVIPKGQSITEIANRLEAAGLVRSSLATKIYIKFSDSGNLIQAGSFRISGAQSVPEIVSSLKHGTLDIWLTFPEGWRSEQIVDELLAKGLLADSPSELYKQFSESEGRLFPDTYLFSKDSTAQQIIESMTATFETKTSRLLENHQPSSRDYLILASLVEREAKHSQDRPLIAGVLTNRLNIGMALQVDATLQYAKASIACPAKQGPASRDGTCPNDWWPTPRSGDKSVNSPYNTYKFPGLPPGPIANPGLAAIEAAFNPAETDYLYYLSEPDGTTHFARTPEEHQANIRRYL